jgi:adenylate kinase family enzyme
LRDEAKSPTSPYRDFIPESIEKSVLLPPQLTTMLLKQEMQKAQAEGARRFLLDGFPRSIVQAADFELKVSFPDIFLSVSADSDLHRFVIATPQYLWTVQKMRCEHV